MFAKASWVQRCGTGVVSRRRPRQILASSWRKPLSSRRYFRRRESGEQKLIDIYQKFRAGLRAHTLAKVLVQAVSWLGTVYVLRTLDAHAIGLFAIASVAFGYASLMYEGSMLETLVQDHPQSLDDRRTVFTLLLVMGVASAAILMALARPIASLSGAPEVAGIIVVMSINLITIAIGILPHARLLHEMRFAPLAVISSVQALVSSVTMIALASAGAGVWSLIWSQLAGALVRTTMLNVSVPSVYLPTHEFTRALRYLRTSTILIADGLLFRWYTSIDVFLLGRWSGTVPLGHFSFGQQVANTPLEKISTVVNDVSLPAYARLAGDRTEARNLMLETMRTHAAIGLPVFWGLASVALTAVPVIFGEHWIPAIFPLIAIAAVAPLRLIGSVETPAMTGIGRASVLLRTKFIIVPTMTVALVCGAWWGGVRGVALTWLIVFPVVYAVAFRLVLRAIGLAYSQVIAAVRGPAIAAAVMSLSVAGLQFLADTRADLPQVIQLLGLIVAGALIYPATLRFVDRQAFDLLRERATLMLSGR